jgi:hypothetical protein
LTAILHVRIQQAEPAKGPNHEVARQAKVVAAHGHQIPGAEVHGGPAKAYQPAFVFLAEPVVEEAADIHLLA